MSIVSRKFRSIALLAACIAALGVSGTALAGSSRDVDGDGVANVRDRDIDGDSVRNGRDRNTDGDALRNSRDRDVDADGARNQKDRDIDGDGQANSVDTDDDADGILDADDPDANGDGVADAEQARDREGCDHGRRGDRGDSPEQEESGSTTTPRSTPAT